MKPDRVQCRPVAGGSIAQSYCFFDEQNKVFVKCMSAGERDVLAAESDGLKRIADTQTVRTPTVIDSGTIDAVAWLALDWIEMQPLSDRAFGLLGEQLAAMHRVQAKRFGLDRDNYIGRSVQTNHPESDWAIFFFEHRMRVQLQWLDQKYSGQDWEAQLEDLQRSWLANFDGYQPEASLLHGDLWSGNTAMTANNQAIIFDPAVHYGDRECDLAMADLFGGFSKRFYEHYQTAWPLQPDSYERRRYYQLYHVLNHANLFGGHYLSSARRLIQKIVDESLSSKTL